METCPSAHSVTSEESVKDLYRFKLSPRSDRENDNSMSDPTITIIRGINDLGLFPKNKKKSY